MPLFPLPFIIELPSMIHKSFIFLAWTLRLLSLSSLVYLKTRFLFPINLVHGVFLLFLFSHNPLAFSLILPKLSLHLASVSSWVRLRGEEEVERESIWFDEVYPRQIISSRSGGWDASSTTSPSPTHPKPNKRCTHTIHIGHSSATLGAATVAH